MMVRCGACRTQFDVATEGRHPCPACGAVNQVAAGPATGGGQPPPAQPPPFSPPSGDPDVTQSPPEPSPLERVSCPECSFDFVVGDIDVATCPNCSTEVEV